MEEKIKVNITQTVNNILLKDMELFEFYKNDGSLNKNAFYTSLITNYYQTFYDNELARINLISESLIENTNLSKSLIDYLSFDLANKLSETNIKSSQDKYSVSLAIKPTKQSSITLAYIEKYLLNNSSISNFYRNLFTSYSKLPQDAREVIIFKQNYETITKAIKNKKKLFLITSKDKNVTISPYLLTKSKEELFNYLLSSTENNKPITFRLSRIKKISILNIKSEIDDTTKELLNRMNEVGPQYMIKSLENDEIIVKLTENGINQFKQSYVNRPIPTKIESNIYYFNCSYSQIYQYFIRFGTSATIIKPESIKLQIYNFHKNGYFHYKKHIDSNNKNID